ncbi:hypothetical protein CATMQ487_24620 [Sphaerotilus microaerophilus]|uniref:Uncharacterized protein n=1 Tax=Sphaerotilus microaerophilus TaxID=2914710 RepID=A0ABN6PMK3_9BURK|nr:hypothetical protein CATMQ487_24620 [Sphaerotilus sp. FB-5]
MARSTDRPPRPESNTPMQAGRVGQGGAGVMGKSVEGAVVAENSRRLSLAAGICGSASIPLK